MLIGTSNVSTDELLLYKDNPVGLVHYVEEMVPKWARCIPDLAHNQRFYVALHVRQAISLPYQTRMSMANALIDGIHLRGTMSSFTPITNILDVCDKAALLRMLERDEENEQQEFRYLQS